MLLKSNLLTYVALAIFSLSANTHGAQTCSPNIGVAGASYIQASTPTEQFINHGDGTVTDTKTGLMWKVCNEGESWDSTSKTCIGTYLTYTWQGALSQAKNLNNSNGFSGYKDWRLPNIKELRSIVELQCADPSINLSIFPTTPSGTNSSTGNIIYWSSSPKSGIDEFNAWGVNFTATTVYPPATNSTFPKTNPDYLVRLVRN